MTFSKKRISVFGGRDISNEIENPTPNPIINSEDSDLQRAIELSLQDME